MFLQISRIPDLIQKFWAKRWVLYAGVYGIQIFGAPPPLFQSHPFRSLKIFRAPPQHLHPPPCHNKWAFPMFSDGSTSVPLTVSIPVSPFSSIGKNVKQESMTVSMACEHGCRMPLEAQVSEDEWKERPDEFHTTFWIPGTGHRVILLVGLWRYDAHLSVTFISNVCLLSWCNS